ncbi:DUF6542 domain-containing protein [Planomonospora venezuelensis]|uniref:DUF6542 domain-containing protein n=1 Tax=Planomonospora venezuelensis TaxID=1999 RepID=A0A841D363_PLAVE|nr:DUF6542 domain-containing protein [Planomonospora venezuelensis]MBB5962828.1 hypothetical protein [Planomonospora venezuelensis]GIM99376.1 hypothetical protein Pve01_10350 [Planomonospora venezuelensis]
MSERNRASGIRLTARGAVAFVLAVTLTGSLLHALLGLPAAVGLAFVAGCAGAVLLVNPRDLLSLVVSPPLIFFSAALVAEALRALSAPSPVQAFGLGMFTALSGGAPWLFTGSALVLVVAWRRGLTRCVRELREEIRTAGPAVPRPRNGDDTGFAPEPEGYFEPRVYGTPREGR